MFALVLPIVVEVLLLQYPLTVLVSASVAAPPTDSNEEAASTLGRRAGRRHRKIGPGVKHGKHFKSKVQTPDNKEVDVLSFIHLDYRPRFARLNRYVFLLFLFNNVLQRSCLCL